MFVLVITGVFVLQKKKASFLNKLDIIKVSYSYNKI